MLAVVLILILASLLIYANYNTRSSQPVSDRITFNPFTMPAECPPDCKKYSFPDDYLTPSLLMTRECGYKKDSLVFPCPSTCCRLGARLGER